MAKTLGGVFYLLPESPVDLPRRVTLTGSEQTIHDGLKRLIGTSMLEPFMLADPIMAYGDEDGRMKMRQLNPWIRTNGTAFDIVGTIVLGGNDYYRGADPKLLTVMERIVIAWPIGGRPGIAGR